MLKPLTSSILCALVVWIAAGASAEPVKIPCQLTNGRNLDFTLNLEDSTLNFGKSSSAQIVQQGENWIVAQTSNIKSLPPFGVTASAGSIVFNRLTGQFWRSEFTYFGDAQHSDSENPSVFTLEGTCKTGF